MPKGKPKTEAQRKVKHAKVYGKNSPLPKRKGINRK